MSDISNSVYNLSSLEELSQKDTVIHRINPLIKFIVTIVYIAVVVSYGRFDVSGVLTCVLFPVVIIALGDIPVKVILKRLVYVLPFILLMGVFNIFTDRTIWGIICLLYTSRHPQIGADILSKSKHLRELKEIVLYHHERYDGNGYPKGLRGEEIPLGSRIIAVCDSIDAMTSNRSYRKAHSYDYCYDEIKTNLGTMYDPVIGHIVISNWEEFLQVIK